MCWPSGLDVGQYVDNLGVTELFIELRHAAITDGLTKFSRFAGLGELEQNEVGMPPGVATGIVRRCGEVSTITNVQSETVIQIAVAPSTVGRIECAATRHGFAVLPIKYTG